MSRRALTTAAVLAASCLGASFAQGDEDVRVALPFARGLRERGYDDLVAEYLDAVAARPDLPEDLKPTLAFERGRAVLETAARTGNLDRRRELLEQARVRLDAFTKAYPKHELTPDALGQLARVLVERGHLAVIRGDEAATPAEKQTRLAEARAAFAQARVAFDQAKARLAPLFAAFPSFIDEEDPRRQERERVRVALMNVELQRAVTDYEDGATHPVASAERKALLEQASAAFDDLYKRYRAQSAGFYAQMWQGKCFEDRGDLGKAMGIYDSLMDHTDPNLRPLQRQVGYFRIVVLAKRGEFALAADAATLWLAANPNETRTNDGLGVQLELAKDIIAQLPALTKASDKEAATRKVVELLGAVVRVVSPHKAEAAALLKQYKVKATFSAAAIAGLSYDAAMAEADEAISALDWPRAIALLRSSIRKADPSRDPEKANRARYLLAYAEYKSGGFYEAAILAEHIARRYPREPLAIRATEIGTQALIDAYNAYTRGDRTTDLDRVVALANYAAETWSDSDQGDFGRVVAGNVEHGRGNYAGAIKALEAVRPGSGKWADARTLAGNAHYKLAQALRAQEPPATAEADAEIAKASEALEAALKNRREAGATNADAGLINNACDLADVRIETGKAAEAIALIDSIAKELAAATRPPELAAPHARVLSTLLRAHIAVGQVDLALADMKALEAAGGSGSGPTQLYFRLGQLLETEMESLRKKGDAKGLGRVQADYQKFLDALVATKGGQTYESLQWAGESMLSIGRPKEAAAVFDRVLAAYEDNAAFNAKLGAGDRLLRTRLKRAAALRSLGDFDNAETLIRDLVARNSRLIEPRFEMGLLMEAKAEAGKGTWDASVAEWKKVASQLGRANPKPPQYFDAWYHAAYALSKQKKLDQARQALAGILRLSPAVGTPAIKAKYQDLLRRIGP